MGERPDRARLLAELRLVPERRLAIGVEELQRDNPAETQVARAVHLTGAAGPDEADNLVRPEAKTGRKAHEGGHEL